MLGRLVLLRSVVLHYVVVRNGVWCCIGLNVVVLVCFVMRCAIHWVVLCCVGFALRCDV